MSCSNTETTPLVWLIGQDHWPRALLRAELIERGVDAIGHVRASHALSALGRPGARRPDAVVVDLQGSHVDRSALSALLRTWIPLIATGGAVDISDPWVHGQRWAAVVPRPVTVGELADTVERLVNSSRTGPRPDPGR